MFYTRIHIQYFIETKKTTSGENFQIQKCILMLWGKKAKKEHENHQPQRNITLKLGLIFIQTHYLEDGQKWGSKQAQKDAYLKYTWFYTTK